MASGMERFLLVDRDGVINRRIVGGFVARREAFKFLPGVLEALALLAEHGISVIVISNQPGVGRGWFSQEALDRITDSFVRQVAESGGCIRKVYYCTHPAEEDCDCRKPKPGLILEARREFGFDPRQTYFIGDAAADCGAAAAAGCPFVLISKQQSLIAADCQVSPRAVFPSLLFAAQYVVEQYSEDN
jgi:D-glycero-D-manno-heptose 1,7-bisphosphate phosphatase